MSKGACSIPRHNTSTVIDAPLPDRRVSLAWFQFNDANPETGQFWHISVNHQNKKSPHICSTEWSSDSFLLEMSERETQNLPSQHSTTKKNHLTIICQSVASHQSENKEMFSKRNVRTRQSWILVHHIVSYYRHSHAISFLYALSFSDWL